MAICTRCGGEITDGISCLTDPITIGDRAYAPVRWGQELRPRHRYEPDECRGCGTPLGGAHHPGCYLERCPACHGQALTCPCVAELEGDSECEFDAARRHRCRAHVLRRVGWR
jgi:hypothetical protein